jgi:hypothetical protein
MPGVPPHGKSRTTGMIRLTDSQLHEVLQAARTVPFDLRQAFLERLAVKLLGKDLGVTAWCTASPTRSRARSPGMPGGRRRG